MNIDRSLPLQTPRTHHDPHTAELHRRPASTQHRPQNPNEPSTSQGDSIELLMHQGAGTVQRISRHEASSGNTSGNASGHLQPGGESPPCGRALQIFLAHMGRACASAARQVHRGYVTTLARFHYTVLAPEEEREAYTRFQNHLIRFRNSRLTNRPGPNLEEAIESFDECMAKMGSKSFDGPINLKLHPLAEFISKRNTMFPRPERYDLFNDIEALKAICKEYQERIDDALGTERELNSGDYADSLKTACFLWQRGIKYREALREVQKWAGLMKVE